MTPPFGDLEVGSVVCFSFGRGPCRLSALLLISNWLGVFRTIPRHIQGKNI